MDNKAKIEWVDVTSSNLAQIAHDEQSGLFAVRFSNGGLYGYKKVGRDIFDAMPNVPSAGRYFNMMVKVGHDFVKLDNEAELLELIERERAVA